MSTSDKELKKAVDLIQPGSCYGHWGKTCKECKICFIVEQCNKFTTNKELIVEEPEVKKPVPKKTITPVKKKILAKKKEAAKAKKAEKPVAKAKPAPVESVKTGDILLDNIIKDVEDIVKLDDVQVTDKSIMFIFDGREMIINYLKKSGKMRLTKGDIKKVFDQIQTEEQAEDFKKALLTGYEN